MKTNNNLRNVLFLLMMISGISSLRSQTLFIQHTIDNNFPGACSVCACDLDGDGNLDILAAAHDAGQIAWWKTETDTSLSFTKFLIDTTVNGIIYVDAADIDGDNDLDVLDASWQGNEVSIWYNNGGDTLSWEKSVLDDNITQAHEIHGAYVDSDTLLDIIAVSGGDHQIIWYRNTGGKPIVWEKNVVDSQFIGARSVVSFDLNNDGYNDLIGAALNLNQVSIWYNSGTSPVQWNKEIIDNAFGGAHWVRIFDIDGDGDGDIIAAGAIPGSLAWWRNNNGNPVQWTKQIIAPNFSGALSIGAADLDLDNDVDVFSAAVNANQIKWWRNDSGIPIAWSDHLILNGYLGAWPVFGVDIDEDGDTDILTCASDSNKVTWLENRTIISGNQNNPPPSLEKYSLFQNFPDPFNSSTVIKYQIPEYCYVSIKVYDIMGNDIVTLVNGYKQAGNHETYFNAVGLASGVYIYKFSAGKYSDIKKMCFIK